MLKFIILGISILVISFITIGCNKTPNNMNDKEEEQWLEAGDLIYFRLYEKYEVDTSGLREIFRITEGTPFVYFLQVHNLDALRSRGDFTRSNFGFPNFDFESNYYQDNYLAISFGREVIEIKNRTVHYGRVSAAITFAEEYHDDMMFLYIMDKVPLRLGMGDEYYFMEEGERVYKEMGVW